MKSTSPINYASKNNIKYLVLIQYTKDKIIILMQKNEEKHNLVYKNKYEFYIFKERLKNLYNFENIELLIECLKKNITEKTLIIEELYQNIIKTKWKIIT